MAEMDIVSESIPLLRFTLVYNLSRGSQYSGLWCLQLSVTTSFNQVKTHFQGLCKILMLIILSKNAFASSRIFYTLEL